MRRKVIVGNWKMNLTYTQVSEFLRTLEGASIPSSLDVGIAPSYVYLQYLKEELKHTSILVGAQDMAIEKEGAYTGDVSAGMLQSLDTDFVIIGHSERRKYHKETDSMINQKVKRALDNSLVPIICVGESMQEREENRIDDVLSSQVRKAVEGIADHHIKDIIIAYEPVWAIGSGNSATPSLAQEACKQIRDIMKSVASPHVVEAMRIQYGGSVNIRNIGEYLREPDIDGALIGGASLDATTFIKMLHALENRVSDE